MRDPFDRIVFGDRFEATRWRHIVREVHPWPNRDVDEVRVQPFWSRKCWGEQAGTAWIDDVEFVELGPRRRPVQATKLLLTNVHGYVPAGKNGRSAYEFPAMCVIPTAGLRQTGATRNTIAVRWNATRPGTRGFNVYANLGDECPATKYFRRTTVWGANSAVVEGLEYGKDYTIKVAALNEDGVEGAATALRARIADTPPETHIGLPSELPAKAPLGLKTKDGVTYLVTPKDPEDQKAVRDRNGEALPPASCRFEFTIDEDGEYLILGRLLALNGSSNSFFFALDGDEEFQWSVPSWAFNKWTWLVPREGKRWHLKPGTHTITRRQVIAQIYLSRLLRLTKLPVRNLRVLPQSRQIPQTRRLTTQIATRRRKRQKPPNPHPVEPCVLLDNKLVLNEIVCKTGQIVPAHLHTPF